MSTRTATEKRAVLERSRDEHVSTAEKCDFNEPRRAQVHATLAVVAQMQIDSIDADLREWRRS